MHRRQALRIGILAATLARHDQAAATSTSPGMACALAYWTDSVLQDPRSGRRMGLRLRPPASLFKGRSGDCPDATRGASPGALPEARSAAAGATRAPLILVSPGLGSGLAHGAPWCEAWQQAGCWVATLSHPVTNDELWDAGRGPFRDRMAAALAAGQYPARVRDVRFVLETLLAREDVAASADPSRLGVAGHSYGALTVQALAGQQGPSQREPRIAAFLALSPSAMTRAVAQRMAAVDRPFLSIIGSHDAHVSFMEGTERIRLGVPLAQRQWIHEQVPPALRALLSVDQADHMTLAGEAVDARRFSRDVPATATAEADAWQVIARVSTLFWQQAFSFRPDRFLADARALLRPADRMF